MARGDHAIRHCPGLRRTSPTLSDNTVLARGHKDKPARKLAGDSLEVGEPLLCCALADGDHADLARSRRGPEKVARDDIARGLQCGAKQSRRGLVRSVAV